MILVLLGACGAAPESLPVLLQNTPGWQVGQVAVSPFIIATAQRGEGPPRRIYIEGDGRAMLSATQPSGDPTPLNPVALHLAQADPLQPVLYLARPCQFVRNNACNNIARWTDLRFTQDVAEAYTQAVAELTNGQPVELVGYSGGAWVALQVAARLPNVTAVRTVAGNLDPAYVNQLHHASPMEIAPWPSPSRLSEVSQVHYTGEEDDVVPPQVALRFTDIQPCSRVVRVPVNHHAGWEERWRQLLGEPLPLCTGLASR